MTATRRKLVDTSVPIRYGRPVSKSPDALKLQLDAAATPERVAAAATFLGRVLAAAYPSLPEDSITLVITNYHMGAMVRARTPEAHKAAERVVAFLENPSRFLDRDPTAKDIATALGSPGASLLHAQLLRPRGRIPLATLNRPFERRMNALASATTVEPALRGTTIVYSQVYRVGRYDDDKAIKIRIRFGDGCHDVELATETPAADFFKAAEREQMFPIHINAVWFRGADGRLYYDFKTTRAVRVDMDWLPVSGHNFVAAMEVAAPSGYVDDDDFAERIDMIRQRRS